MEFGPDRPSVDQWRRELAEPLANVLGGAARVGSVTLLIPPKEVADDPMKLLVRDRSGQPAGVLLCAAPVAPELVAGNMQRARRAKQALGADLGRAILDPLLEGWAFGLSYALLPYCRPLSDARLLRRVQRLALGPALFGWLRRATQSTVTDGATTGPDPEIITALERLAAIPELTDRARSAAGHALDRLDRGAWRPRRVLMHGDFYLGNVLIDPGTRAGAPRRSWPWPWSARFVIIDWPGSRTDGFAFFDLVRMAQSTRPPRGRLRAEVAAHCRLLGCEPADARSYLAAALGDLGGDLEYFPIERYAEIADSSLKVLEDLGV